MKRSDNRAPHATRSRAKITVEVTFKTGKDALGWDQSQARTYHAISRHTALTALAQLRTAAIQAALAGADVLPAAAPAGQNAPAAVSEPAVSAADLQIYTGTAPLPARGGQPCPPDLPPIGLSAAETARIERLARDWKAGLLSLARLAFNLRWSAWRRRHQARARWHHYSARLPAAITQPRTAGKQVTPRNRQPASTTSLPAAA